MKLPSWNRHTKILIVILAVATGLRFAGLTVHSLWVDELHSVREADPAITWGEMISYLLCCDLSPPLFYAAERILFTLFGYTDWVARALPATCGVVSVWGMYLLGKEILDKNLGLIAAALAAVNYYNFYYSQEARNYILLFLLTVFSYLYFFRLLRTLSRKDMIGFAVFSIAALYTHYFGLFIVASQAFVAFLFMFTAENRNQFLKTFSLAGGIIIIGFLPWVPSVIQMMKVTSVWMPIPAGSFMLDYFHEYYGNSPLVIPFMILLLLYYAWNLFVTPDVTMKNIKDHRLHFSFLVFFIGILFAYFVPYLRSLLVVSMLFGRYTIVAVPGILIAISFAIYLIRNRVAQSLVLFFVIMLSFIDIVFTKKSFAESTARKTQFRQATEYIVNHSPVHYPIVEEKTSWHHEYYLRQFHYQVPVFQGRKEATVESIINKTKPEYDISAFWLVGAHGFEPHLKPEVQQKLDSAFTLVTQKEFYDIWTELYLRKDTTLKKDFSKIIPVASSYFPETREIEGDFVIPIWSGFVESAPMLVTPGTYTLNILQRGTSAQNKYAHINVYLNGKNIGNFTSTVSWSEQRISFDAEPGVPVIFKFELDNDLMDGMEDRNCFIKTITIINRVEK